MYAAQYASNSQLLKTGWTMIKRLLDGENQVFWYHPDTVCESCASEDDTVSSTCIYDHPIVTSDGGVRLLSCLHCRQNPKRKSGCSGCGKGSQRRWYVSRVNGSDHRWAPVDWEGKARSTLEKRVPMIPKRRPKETAEELHSVPECSTHAACDERSASDTTSSQVNLSISSQKRPASLSDYQRSISKRPRLNTPRTPSPFAVPAPEVPRFDSEPQAPDEPDSPISPDTSLEEAAPAFDFSANFISIVSPLSTRGPSASLPIDQPTTIPPSSQSAAQQEQENPRHHEHRHVLSQSMETVLQMWESQATSSWLLLNSETQESGAEPNHTSRTLPSSATDVIAFWNTLALDSWNASKGI